MTATPTITIRPFAAGDETSVLELLDTTLGGGPAGRRPAAFFRWKHWDNPFGPSLMLVAECDGRLIGLRAFLRWRFECDGRAIEAVRAVDTATHPNYQGLGVFSRLTLSALQELQSEADLVFNTPNAASRPGYLKLGWREVGRVPVSVRVRRPLRVVGGLRAHGRPSTPMPPVEAEHAAHVLERGVQVTRLLVAARPADDGRLRTPRDLRYVRWRYGAAPLLGYRAVVDEEAGELRGLAIFRVRPRGTLWESTVAEVLAPVGDQGVVRRLLHRVVAAAAVDHITLRVADSTMATSLAGFLPAPGGVGLVVKPLSNALVPDATNLKAWALSLGDMEVF